MDKFGEYCVKKVRINVNNNRIKCPCCGQMTIEEKYDICPICDWEYDPVQNADEDYAGGANQLSLRKARANYEKYGSSEGIRKVDSNEK